VIVILAVLSTWSSSDAQWIQTNGPDDEGSVTFMASGSDGMGGSMVVAAANYEAYHEFGDILISLDAGNSWSVAPTHDHVKNASYTAIAVYEGCIYAWMDSGDLLRSTDRGATWSVIACPITSHINCVCAFGNLIFTGADDGLYKSSDKGNTWKPVGSIPTYTCIMDLVVHGNKLYTCTQTNGICMSVDSGAHWNALGTQLSTSFSRSMIVTDSGVYIGTADGLYRTSNNGVSWNRISAEFAWDLEAADDTIVALFGWDNRSLCRSTDNGATWTNSSMKKRSFVELNQLTSVDGGMCVCGGDIYRSSDDGTSWQAVELHLHDGVVTKLATHGSSLFAATEAGCFKTVNEGYTWERVRLHSDAEHARALEIYDSLIVVVTTEGLFSSSDSGVTWSSMLEGTAHTSAGVQRCNGYWYAVLDTMLMRRAINDTAWVLCSTRAERLVCVDSTLFIYGSLISPTVQMSTDAGITWKGRGMWSPPKVLSFSAVDRSLYAGVVELSGMGLYNTTDYGITWERDGFRTFAVREVIKSGQYLFAATDSSVFLRGETGDWICVADGLSGVRIDALAVSGDYLYAGTHGKGVWKRNLSDVVNGIPNDVAKLPLEFRLDQNFPNPFSSGTQITIQMPQGAIAALKIYDALGREVAHVLDGYLSAGTHSVRWNAGPLPGGAYFCSFRCGAQNVMKTMIKIRD
jgi:photosystem II stability/assembly factor-like uncharacterized protein